MKRDVTLDALQTEHIDHILTLWHHWCATERGVRGYPGVAAGCGMYRASRQYDLDNGAMDQAADAAQCQAVDNIIRDMTDPHRSALHMEARCLATARVWRSARVDLAAAERVMAEAREMLWAGLVNEGLA